MKKVWTSVLALCVIVVGIFIAAPFAVPQIALASPGFAAINPASLLERVSNLEDRISALEAQISALTSMSHAHQPASQAPAPQAPSSQAPTPVPTATPIPASQTSGAVAYDTANIVNAPGGSLLRTVSAGTPLDIIGYYNDADNATWYKLRDGGWILYTSVSGAPGNLPYIYYPQK